MKLKDISELQYGPYEKTMEAGDTKYLLASHFNEYGQLTDFSESFINIEDKQKKFLLKPNDVIYAAKGSRMFAWAYDPSFGDCIPSSLFYIIRVNSAEVRGEYLAYYLNTERVQFEIKNKATGGGIQSVPKKELLELDVMIPSIEEQEKIIAIGKLIDQDIELTEQLLSSKLELKKGLITKMITNQIQT